jgi:hypothetical protein
MLDRCSKTQITQFIPARVFVAGLMRHPDLFHLWQRAIRDGC